MTDPDPLTLRLFLSIVDLGNLTAAAQRHHLAASAVSKRISDLEAQFGVSLLLRQARGVSPTPAGEELARQARALAVRIDRIKAIMSEFAEGARGQVTLHASASVLLEALAPAIVRFTRAHPLIRIELQELMSWAIVRDVVEGRADVGVIADSFEVPGGLTTLPYAEDRLMALMPPDHVLASRRAVSFADLLDHDQVGIGATSALSTQLAEAAGRLNRVIRLAYRTATYDVARRLVAAGAGLAILPRSMVLPYLDTGTLVGIPLADPWARRMMRICYRDDSTLTVAARLFIAHLVETSGFRPGD